ncbi:TauD/TfdA dioxygenase family protein [Altericroceibacterium endophyticum]|uniref:Taurine dioxygenase n=1 Tax=Altericroceibacterium endophyticum TaxID=1808508 RepID=A0A6I4T4P1_9SPHN|nr:TauD/TfdA family dioxygenase [Altericroceibacterium endophyticum]MXO65013.1 taurine dioxygenase [Altericroceibacterium endophyticum]
MPYETIDVRPVTKSIGAEIFGVDLNEPLSNSAQSEIHDALMEHQVIFFRDQKLNHDSHIRLGRAFGELAYHSGVAGLDDYPEIVKIHADAESTFVAGENWHSDLSEYEEPPMGSILYMHTLPPVGGDTLWSSMYAAYDALSDEMKAFLEPLTAVHDSNHIYRELFPDVEKTYPCNTHPVIRTHPVTKRKCLFVNASKTTKINGLPKAEGDALLAFLFDHVKNPNFQVRFRWQPHSIAFWDNRCTQHFATWDYFPETRSGYRVTIAGDKPY